MFLETRAKVKHYFDVWPNDDLAYLNWKFDKHPVIGNPPNYKRLKELGKKGVKCLVVDSLYSDINSLVIFAGIAIAQNNLSLHQMKENNEQN